MVDTAATGRWAAIEAIEEDAWTPISYWLSTPEVCGADVAKTTYTAFSGKEPSTCGWSCAGPPAPGSQLALFTTWDYHAFTRLLAPGTRHRASPREHSGDPDALLNNAPRPNDQDLGEAGRPAVSARPGPSGHHPTQIPATTPTSPSQTVDPG